MDECTAGFLKTTYQLQRLHRVECCEITVAYGKSEGIEEDAIVASSDWEEPVQSVPLPKFKQSTYLKQVRSLFFSKVGFITTHIVYWRSEK